jgi:NADH-ubiquinone oxidoreductase chain 6
MDSSDSLITSSLHTNLFYEFINIIKSIFVSGDDSAVNIMFVTSNNWDGNLTETNHAASVGLVIYTVFNMWLLIASIILLLAMVGAIVITIK